MKPKTNMFVIFMGFCSCHSLRLLSQFINLKNRLLSHFVLAESQIIKFFPLYLKFTDLRQKSQFTDQNVALLSSKCNMLENLINNLASSLSTLNITYDKMNFSFGRQNFSTNFNFFVRKKSLNTANILFCCSVISRMFNFLSKTQTLMYLIQPKENIRLLICLATVAMFTCLSFPWTQNVQTKARSKQTVMYMSTFKTNRTCRF